MELIDTRIELRHLRYFVAVAEELHFGRAAARLRLAQPALSQQIRQLEAIIGHRLLERTSRAVHLTPSGAVFLDRAHRTLRGVADDVAEAQRVGRGETGLLRVGFVGSSMLTRVPQLLGAYRERYPGVQLRLQESFTAVLTAGLARGELDVAILRDPDEREGISQERFLVERFIAVVPRGHRCARRARISAAELRGDSFVLFPRAAGAAAYARTVAVCQAQGFEPRVVQEAPQWLTILRLVGAGLGVTIAPESVAQIANTDVRCVALQEARERSAIAIAARVGDERAVVRNFIALARGD